MLNSVIPPVHTFSGEPKKLCIWHVDRAWRKAISCIKSKEEQVVVYHTLRVLLEETECENFELLLRNALTRWRDITTMCEFYKYFSNTYANRCQQCASCYRRYAEINENMYVEAFHCVLYSYLKGTMNKRMDTCIHALLKYARDKAFDRLSKMEKGKSTSRIRINVKRHEDSCSLSTDLVSEYVYK